jgi:glutamyl-tRNA reductase
VDWEDLMRAVGSVDAMITCTGATEPVFSRDELAEAARDAAGGIDGDGEPLLVVDIAVPPDVGPASPLGGRAARRGGSVRVLDLEDVGRYQKDVELRRCQAAAAGDRIVKERLADFEEWLRLQGLGPKMSRLRHGAEQALAKELRRLPGGTSAADAERLEGFGQTLIKRFLGVVRRIEDEEG